MNPLPTRLLACLIASLPVTAHAMQCEDNRCVCFTKNGEDCAAIAAAEIAKATQTLEVQAYSFTEPRIADAFVAAEKRGVDVRAIFDKTDPNARGGKAEELHDAGIPSLIDNTVAIAHNKVIVIDGKTCLGGSFNYTTSANEKNAENMTVTYDDPTWCGFYAQNFARRAAVSEQYTGGGE